MSKINLLPWREAVKQARNKNFFTALGFYVFMSVLVVLLCDFMIDYQMGVQYANAEYINRELDKVKSEISEIQKLKENKQQLLERLGIINSLQIDRPSIVKLLDMLPRTLPESVYLTLLSRTEIDPPVHASSDEKSDSGKNVAKLLGDGGNAVQTGQTVQDAIPKKKYLIKAEGVALTNGSISIFLKQLQEIKWLTEIKLNEVSIAKDTAGLTFKLEFVQTLNG